MEAWELRVVFKLLPFSLLFLGFFLGNMSSITDEKDKRMEEKKVLFHVDGDDGGERDARPNNRRRRKDLPDAHRLQFPNR